MLNFEDKYEILKHLGALQGAANVNLMQTLGDLKDHFETFSISIEDF